MANTYTGIYLHVVFSVKNRVPILAATFRERVYQYIKSVIHENGHETFAIGGIDNHVHILICYNPKQTLPELMRCIKALSSKFINEQRFVKCHFEWQRGYGAFSNSHRELPQIINYINRQSEHHKGMSVEDELRMILDRYELPYDEKYLNN